MPKSDGSRVRRESHARFCERPVVQFHRPTHPGFFLHGQIAIFPACSVGSTSPHFLVEVSRNSRMIGPTPVFMRFCGAKDTPEACTQWVNNKTSPFSSLSTPR